MRTAFLVGAWLVSRAFVVWLVIGPESWVNGDAGYFAASLQAVPEQGLAHVLVEYPLPAVAALAGPWLLAQVLGADFTHVLMATAVLTDLAFGALLWCCGGRRREAALLVWVLAVPLIGATAYTRFDLLPGVLAGVALLLLARRPRVALASAAVATGVKLWPALLLPGLLARVRRRGEGLATVALVGGVLVVATVAAAGVGRLFSPLTYEAHRGLQIEAVAATPAILAWWSDPAPWQIAYAPSKAYEITGPGVSVLLGVSFLATALLVVALVAAWGAAWRHRDSLAGDTVVWLSLAAVTGFVVTGKVLSPQYLLWLLPMAAAGLAVTARGSGLSRWTALLLVATGLTHLVFPTFYGGLTLRNDHVDAAVWLLLARNIVMVVLAVTAWWRTLLCLQRDAQRGMPLDRQPPGPEEKTERSLR